VLKSVKKEKTEVERRCDVVNCPIRKMRNGAGQSTSAHARCGSNKIEIAINRNYRATDKNSR
jgi:hypothetical protein